MKITNAWIDEPTLRGKLAHPELCVEVDSMPVATIPPERFAGGWTVGKYGPFVKFTAPTRADAGDYNVRFRNRFPVVVDVTLFLQGEEKGQLGYSLLLDRARQVVRKFQPRWRLLVSDREAEAGSLLWLPVESYPGCHFYITESSTPCGRTPARMIRVGDIDLAMCERHIKEHNDKQASRRATASR